MARSKRKTTASGFIAIGIVLAILAATGYYMMKSAKESAPTIVLGRP